MNTFKRISIDTAKEMLSHKSTQLLDIRDELSFQSAHIDGARHLDGNSVQDFLQDAEPDQAVIVYCYHGNSSQSAAAFLYEKGFEDVYSMDGGFEDWRKSYPVSS